MTRRLALAGLLLVPLVACPGPGHPSSQPPPMRLAVLPEGVARPTEEAIWEVLLAGYAAHAFPSEGDMVRKTLAATGSGPGGRAPVVLLARRDSTEAAYHRPWLESLRARSLVASVCPATGPGYCPGGEVKTYLEFHDPKFPAPDTAVVTVYEQGIDWSTCGRGGGGFGGDLTVEFRLARTSSGWTIIARDQQQGSTIIC